MKVVTKFSILVVAFFICFCFLIIKFDRRFEDGKQLQAEINQMMELDSASKRLELVATNKLKYIFDFAKCENSLQQIMQDGSRWIDKKVNKAHDLPRRKWIFDDIYLKSGWGGGSGPGNNVRPRCILEQIFVALDIGSMFDGACGDFRWMHVFLTDFKQKYDVQIKYWGNDIVENVISSHLQKYVNETNEAFLKFTNEDLTQCEKWPNERMRMELIFIHKALQHNSMVDVQRILQCADNSGAKWLLVNSYDDTIKNRDIRTGEMSYYNLSAAPFNLPVPFVVYNEFGPNPHLPKAINNDRAMDRPYLHLYQLPLDVTEYYTDF